MSFLVYWTLCNPTPLLTWPLYAWVFPSSPPQILKIYFCCRTCFNLFWGIFTALRSTLVNLKWVYWSLTDPILHDLHAMFLEFDEGEYDMACLWFYFISHSSLVAQTVKNLPAKQETWVWSWVGKRHGKGMPGKRHGEPLQYSCLENPMDRGACQAAVHGVVKSQTQLSD